MRYFSYLLTLFISFTSLCIFTSCEKTAKSTLKIAATSIPHAEILEFIQSDLRTQNIELEILFIDDFSIPNRALADGEVDANFFQHLPFLENQKIDFGYALESLVAVHLEPMALYSRRYQNLKEIPNGSKIAIPSDTSNQARALALCEQIGLISLKTHGPKVSLLDIAYNPYSLRFIEIDSSLLSRALEDVDIAAISTNFALLAGLSPKTDALAIENHQSHFANLIVIRSREKNRTELQTLKNTLTTQRVKQFIHQRYQGAIIPIF